MKSQTQMDFSRIDYYPTHQQHGYRFRRGRTLPFGATVVPNGVNFSIFSSAATSCTLVLFRKHEREAMVEIEFPREFRVEYRCIPSASAPRKSNSCDRPKHRARVNFVAGGRGAHPAT